MILKHQILIFFYVRGIGKNWRSNETRQITCSAFARCYLNTWNQWFTVSLLQHFQLFGRQKIRQTLYWIDFSILKMTEFSRIYLKIKLISTHCITDVFKSRILTRNRDPKLHYKMSWYHLGVFFIWRIGSTFYTDALLIAFPHICFPSNF